MNAGKRIIPLKNSIETRLVGILAVMLALILLVNFYIYRQINSMVSRIDSVFASNVTISELGDALQRVDDNVYEYLNTKGSRALENYYRYAEEYRTLIEQLNDRITDHRAMMMERSIRNMSEFYLNKADETVQAKRGRNVERYKASYAETKQLQSYINDYIYELNQMQFQTNSENYQFLLSVMNIMEMLALAVMILIFAYALLAAILLIRSMIRPLTDLSLAARQVAEGDFNVEIPKTETLDEIGIVTRTFDQMLGSIRAYIIRVRTSLETQAQMKERELSMEASLKEARLKFLQAQINPHFLFNSLNAGTQLAMMEEADLTGVFLSKMADFFRYNVQKSDGSATLGEEISLVDNYIYILNVRFAGDISYESQIDEKFLAVPMPGMILQPLVENAVNHGIRDMLDRGRILLRVEGCEEGVLITVKDNGIGMTREQIEQVRSGSFQRDENEDTTGIGLANVIRRLELYYNREDLVGIYSEGKGLGTEVTVILPVEDDLQQTDSLEQQ